MIFSFNEDIRKCLKDDCHVLIRDNIDNKVMNYVVNEVFPYYVLSNNQETHVRDLLSSVENTNMFYGKTNIVLTNLRKLFSQHLDKEGWIKLHSSVVTLDNHAVIFIADSQKGKSSSEFLLCKNNGYSFLANDSCFIHPEIPIVVGDPSGFGLSHYSAKHLDFYNKSQIIDEKSVWFSSQHIRQMGYDIQPLSEISVIIFINFHKGFGQDYINVVNPNDFYKFLGNNHFNNNQLSRTMLNKIPMYYISTTGLNDTYQNQLKRVLKR